MFAQNKRANRSLVPLLKRATIVLRSRCSLQKERLTLSLLKKQQFTQKTKEQIPNPGKRNKFS